MSFPKKGKSFPKKGKSFPKRGGGGGSDFSLDDHAFAMKIASALTSELKDRNSRAKLVAGWTGASERTVKNWISGRSTLRPTPRSTGSAFRPGAKCHFVNGGSAGSFFWWKRRASEAKGVGVGGHHRGVSPAGWRPWRALDEVHARKLGQATDLQQAMQIQSEFLRGMRQKLSYRAGFYC
jgi:hypothetical protein